MTLDVKILMESVAASLRHSLEMYWPSDVDLRNDPNERNLSIHFSHVLMTMNFGVFAEARFPAGCSEAKYLDILGISPDGDFFVVAEFKKHSKGAGMTASTWDVDRALMFDLHRGLSEPRWSKRRVEISANCTTGIGIVGGLKWRSRNRSADQLNRAFDDRIAAIGGTIGEPIVVWQGVKKGAYYLSFAHFPIRRLASEPPLAADSDTGLAE